MHVAQPKRDVREQVDRGAAEQRGRGHDFSDAADMASVFFNPTAISAIPATIGKCR